MRNDQAWCKIEREFDAPIDTIWDMWADPAMFKTWYGPKGASIPVCEWDLSLGSTRKVSMEMKMPDRTMTMWFTGVFKEITPKTRLVYTEAMADPEGNVMSPSAMGMPEGTPDFTEVIVELAENGGKTKMTMVHVGVPAGSPGEGGWNMAIDKLAAAVG